MNVRTGVQTLESSSDHDAEWPAAKRETSMTVPSPRVPFRFESVAKMAFRSGEDLKSLIVQVPAGLQKIDQLHSDMLSSLMGGFAILQGPTGSGKTTLLETAGLFREGVETVVIKRDESVRESLKALPPFAGTLQIIVIADRESLSDTSEAEIEAAILATNAFLRTDVGERRLVVWPCNSDPIAAKLVAIAGMIGGSALLGVAEPTFAYPGPPRAEYLRIARNTIATFNHGASLANLGISDDRAASLAGEAETIGSFLKLLQNEERKNREILTSKLIAREQCRVWVVVIAKNDPDVDGLTRGSYSVADIDRLVSVTDANIVREFKKSPERLGLLGAAFDVKILRLPALTAIEVIQEFADPPLRQRLAELGFAVMGSIDARGRLLDSPLASALQNEPIGTLSRGRKVGSDRLAPFDALMIIAQTHDAALNRVLGIALQRCDLIEQFQTEVDFGAGLKRKSDLVCNAHLDPVRLELMWRKKTSRAEIANYALTKLARYGDAIGFL